MEFVELTEVEFASFALHHELCNLWQTPQMAKLREQRGFHTYYVGIRENNEIIAGSMLSSIPVFMGFHRFQLLRGPLLDFHNRNLFTFFHENLVAYVKKHKGMSINMNPYIPYKQRNLDGDLVDNGFDNSDIVDMFKDHGYIHEGFTRGYDLSKEPRWIYTIDLKDKTSEDVLQQMERKTSRSVKKALKYQIEVKELTRDRIHIFQDIIDNTRERRGFEGRDLQYYETLYDQYHPQGYIKFLYASLHVENYMDELKKELSLMETEVSTCMAHLATQESGKIRKKMQLAQEQVNQLHEKLLEADALKRDEGEDITLASGVFFTYGREVLCLMSGVYERFMKFASPYAMHWKMMNYIIDHNMERYNLYGLSGVFDEQAEDYGVYLFKKGFNGEVIELVGDFEYIVEPAKYKLYQGLRNVKHKISK